MRVKIYCDGGARGNPGPAAIGVAAEFSISNFQFSNPPNVNTDGRLRISKYIGFATNNQAEYKAVIHALKWLRENRENLDEKIKKIRFFLDSNLVVNQLNGRFKVKNSNLRELLLIVRGLENQIEIPITYQFIPREKNKEADKLVNDALNHETI